jgi:hypothetical protein
MVHGDDFLACGTLKELRELEAILGKVYEIKLQLAGPWLGADRSLKVLGRILTFTQEGIGYEADPRQLEGALEAMDMVDCKTVESPWAAEKSHEVDLNLRRSQAQSCRQEAVEWQDDLRAEALGMGELKRYQSVAAKLNYLALDRPDVQFPIKELMRKMSAPTDVDEQRLKRILRCLKGCPRVIQTFPFGPLPDELTLCVDSKFAGCAWTRKSTSGGVICWGAGVLKSWSKTQSTIALSSGEAELAAVAKGATEGLGMQAIMKDFGIKVGLAMFSDATAAIGMVKREGLGKVRHLAVADLWVQQRVRGGEISVSMIPGPENPSGICTKGVDAPTIKMHLQNLLITPASGRHQLAPALS